MAEFLRVFRVKNTDTSGNPSTPRAYFSNQVAASEYANGKGDWGTDLPVSSDLAVRIEGKVYILAQPDPIDLDRCQALADEKLRKETMASLTPDQIRVLGILVGR